MVMIKNDLQKKIFQKTKLLLFFVLFPSFLWGVQSGGAKSEILIEEELEQEFKTLEEEADAADDEIIVLGEDELLIRTKKSETDIVVPTDIDSLRWRDSREFLVKKGKQEGRGKKSSVGAGFAYGLYRNFRFYLDASNNSKYGLFRILYNRESLAGVGNDGATLLPESSFETDRFLFSGNIRFSESYTMGLSADFHRYGAGLQQNSSYQSLEKLTSGLTWNHNFNFGQEQTLLVGFFGHFMESQLYNTLGYDLSDYFDLGLQTQWKYISPERIRIEVKAGYAYRNSELAGGALQENHLLDASALVHWPLLLSRIKESQTPLQLDLVTGALLFFDPLYGWFPGPVFGLNFRVGGFDSRLRIARESGIPEAGEYHIEPTYQKMQHFSTARDAWYATWKNRLELSEQDHLKLDGGYYEIANDYDFIRDADGLYLLESIYNRYWYVEPGYERALFEGLYVDLALRYVSYLDPVNLRSPLVWMAALRYESTRVDVTLEYFYEGERTLEGVAISPYHNLGFRFLYRINPKAALYINGENLLNQVYSLYPSYQEQGVNVLGGIKITL